MISGSGVILFTSADSLHFDTVFTGTQTPTQSFKIYNPNSAPLLINRIILSGSLSSPFKINVNGMAAPGFSNIQIAANDSIYVFVSLSVDANAQLLPFIVQDSILIDYSGSTTLVFLDGFGQNARHLNNATITKDTTWQNDLPVLINGPLIIKENVTLTMLKGVQVFCHANAAINVYGTLITLGERDDSMQVNFNGDRLDFPYNQFPGSWPGIIFHPSSTNNELYSTNINNADKALDVREHGAGGYKLKLFQCKIQNALHEGIKAAKTSLYAENSLVTNCGSNNISLSAGTFDFTHCTLAGYSTRILNRLQPLLFITDNVENGQAAATFSNFTNCIIYGESGYFEDEIDLQRSGSNFQINFLNCLFKGSGDSEAQFVDCIQNADPYFNEINNEENQFDFHLAIGSPCIDAGKPTMVLSDLEGNSRTGLPDIGCYETK